LPKLWQRVLHWDNEKKWSCPECGFTLYNNVAGAVAVVIRCGDEIYLTRRNRDPKKGNLILPEDLLIPKKVQKKPKRGAFEELQLDIDISNLKYLTSLPNIYQYKEIDYNTIDLFYEYNVSREI
jgi:ADP-ribose pyrophosphatase YjhB (NUDIX family)